MQWQELWVLCFSEIDLDCYLGMEFIHSFFICSFVVLLNLTVCRVELQVLRILVKMESWKLLNKTGDRK